MLEAVLITLLAAAGNNIGKALQKQATLGLPHFELNARVLMQYLRSPVYLLGMGVDIGGALLMIVAFAKAPVSVVQPVASAGLGALAVFSHFYLKERMSKTEWLAVAIAAMGTIGLGLTAEDQDDNTVDIRRALLTLLVCLIAVLAMAAHSLRQTRSAWGDASATAAVVGLQAGGAFGLSAACCRTGLLLGRQQMFAVPVGIGTSIGLTSTGFALQTRGFKDGNTVIVCTCAAVSAMVTGVVVGMVGLGETLPPGKEAKILQGASWLAIMAGVAMLSGAGGFKVVIPKRFWSWLPPWLSLRLRKILQGPARSEPPLLPLGRHLSTSTPMYMHDSRLANQQSFAQMLLTNKITGHDA